MKKFLSGLRGKTLLFLFITGIALTQTSCNRHLGPRHGGGGPVTNHVTNWLNWNYIFKPGTDSAARQRAILQITNAISSVRSTPVDTSKQPVGANVNIRQAANHSLTVYLTDYLRKKLRTHSEFSLDSTEVHFCSCHDTLLWNVTSNLNIGGSGQSAPSSPGPNGPGPSGDAIAVVDSNGAVTAPTSSPLNLAPGHLVGFSGPLDIVDSVVLGIIDTGIDPTLFSSTLFSQLFASDGSGTVNFVANTPATDYIDTDPVRHGSAVAAITLDAFYAESQKDGGHKLPRLMVLRALDGTGMGNAFSVGCALSYAVSHHATLINASLGYWNGQSEFINYYLRLTTQQNIPVVAAAGNTPGEHAQPLCEDNINWHNRLRPGNMFYPACQSVDPAYCIISVTGLNNPWRPCRYQNFSSRYVSVGVVHQDTSHTCCGFSLPFISSGFVLDGSSFATPVISGKLGYQMMKHGRRNSPEAYIDYLQTQKINHKFLTWRGQYITY